MEYEKMSEDLGGEDAAAALPSGKSSPASLLACGNVDVRSNYVALELESAQLELEAAEAMKRAANAKRRAAAALRADRLVRVTEEVDDVPVDDQIRVKLPLAGDKVASPTTRYPWDCEPSTSHVRTSSDMLGYNIDKLLTRLELPRCELPCFDGSPSQYISFFRQFDEQVENRVEDDGQRLTYLYHYCRGKAKDAIQGCLVYPAAEGYKKARAILKELFGRRHMIVQSMLQEITAPGQLQTDAESLFVYVNKLQSCADAMERLGFLADLNSSSTLDQILSKLPRYMAVDWVKRADEIYQSDREPEFRDLCEFICAKARLHRNRYSYLLGERKSPTDCKPKEGYSRGKAFAVVTQGLRCPCCNGVHSLEQCTRFQNLSVKERWELVSTKKLCFVCLNPKHRASACSRNIRCPEKDCDKLHHRLLHSTPDKMHVTSASCQRLPSAGGVSLGVIPVLVEGPKGSVIANALLDSGADSSLVRDDLLPVLGLQGTAARISLDTPIGEAHRRCTQVSLRLRSIDGKECLDIAKAYTVPSILNVEAIRPTQETLSNWSHLKDVSLPPLPSKTLSILIGLDTPEAHWVLEQRRGVKGDPYADRTPLGWVLRGPLDNHHRCKGGLHASCIRLHELEESLRRFYDGDFMDNSSFETKSSAEEERAIDMLEKSLEIKEGHLCVCLPWKDSSLKGKCNRISAVNRLMALEKRFLHDNNFQERYSAVISRYIEKGFAKPVSESSNPDELCWYLPHHAVLNPKKPDKVRVVFDCAAKFNGESLNDHLLPGPNLVSSLVGVLLRFRQGPIALSADIEDMFLQVWVPERDQGALRFLWYPDTKVMRDPEELRLTVHPFGAVSSPFCASFALKKVGNLFGHEYPLDVSQAILNSFYVDDFLKSVTNENEAVSLVEGLCSLLSQGGFKLTKWLSNSREVLNRIPDTLKGPSVKNMEIEVLPTQRTLGLLWTVEQDVFAFQFEPPEPPPTRRVLLSQLSSVFDPLGWIGPYIFPLKILFQKLCRQAIGWDQLLAPAVIKEWRQSMEILGGIRHVRIPRWYASTLEETGGKVELHAFCDASEVGYGAVCYLRFVQNHNPSLCVLVIAKSRVAPLRTVSIPRLELNAAVLAVELTQIVKRECELTLSDTVYWTDSAIVLHYLRNETSRFSTFVSNRISKIKGWTTVDQWRHISGKDNPADLASRGMRCGDRYQQLWFGGPVILREPGGTLPNYDECPPISADDLELKSKVVISTLRHCYCPPYFGRFSCWLKLLRCVAWLLRYKRYLLVLAGGRADLPVRLGPLTVQELRDSCKEVVRMVQAECFGQEIEQLSNGQSLPSDRSKRGQLYNLKPILIDGLIRVGGRLHWSSLSEDSKHPIVLPSRHHVTELVIRHYHEVEGHVGSNQVLSTIRRRYWIVHGRVAVRRVIGKCLRCRRESARPGFQLMAPLPKERACIKGYAFAQVGVDYFGPFFVRRGRTVEKRYGCLFTCLNIRAVHLEVAHSLSTDSFIQALIRFMARRGQPEVIFSDNGSNFRGAYAELRQCIQGMSQAKIQQFLVNREVRWHFGPPDASHWGGVWERMIRTVRKVFRAVSHSQRMTDETLLTFFAEVEKIVNNRPLTPISEDVRDLEVLTPNKLLLLRDNETEIDHLEFPQSCIRLWRRVQVLVNTFWKRWKSEYLASLQERHKWQEEGRELKAGDLVLVTTEGVHRNCWPLGVISEVLPSEDGLIREVLVRTSHGTLRRDVRKLCWLEGDDG